MLKILDGIGPNDILHLEHQTRQLFAQAIAALRHPYGVADLHALEVRGSDRHQERFAGEQRR